MSITGSIRVNPKIYKYSPYEALSFRVGGSTEIISIANETIIESGHPYPSSPAIYEIPVNGTLLVLVSGSVDSAVTLSMYHAFDDENFYLYDEKTFNVSASGITISGIAPFYCGYWKFQATPTVSGTYTVQLKVQGL